MAGGRSITGSREAGSQEMKLSAGAAGGCGTTFFVGGVCIVERLSRARGVEVFRNDSAHEPVSSIK